MDRWSYPVPMAMQRHTGCHLPPRESELPAEHEAKPEAKAIPAADQPRQPAKPSQD